MQPKNLDAYSFKEMIACFDVQYSENLASVAAVVFKDWADENPLATYSTFVEGIDDYQSGAFYKRELPCLRKVIDLIKEPISTMVVDGHVYLSDQKKPGLGAYLYKELSEGIPVIGVGKNSFKDLTICKEVFRGESQKPLYVSSVGISVEEAAKSIESMHGDFRFPTLLKLVDSLAREGVKKA